MSSERLHRLDQIHEFCSAVPDCFGFVANDAVADGYSVEVEQSLGLPHGRLERPASCGGVRLLGSIGGPLLSARNDPRRVELQQRDCGSVVQ